MRVQQLAATAAVLMAMGAGTAAAQTPTYGGGGLPYPKGDYASVGVTLQPRGSTIAVRFDTTLVCGKSPYDIVGRQTVPWDGRSFTASAARTLPIGSKGSHSRVDFRWTISGQADGTNAAGVLRVTGTRHVGRRTATCNHRTTRGFSARLVAPAATGAPKPPGGAVYGGVSTLSVADGLPGPVLVKATRDGSKVYARWTGLAPCGKGPRVTLLNITPAATVQPDGSFSHPERFALHYADAFIRYHVTFAGRISGESASGTLRLQARIYDLRGTKLTTTCDSKPRTWTAGLVRPPAAAPARATPTEQPPRSSEPGPSSSPGSAPTSIDSPSSSPGSSPAQTDSPPASPGSPPAQTDSPPAPSDPPLLPPTVLPGQWSLSMTSDTGDWVGRGRSWSYPTVGDEFWVSGTPELVQFRVQTTDDEGHGDFWSGNFSAPPGQSLTAGRTYSATRYPFNGENAGFDFYGLGHGCNILTATFTFKELTFDPDGKLRTARATFTQHCEAGAPALHGAWTYSAPPEVPPAPDPPPATTDPPPFTTDPTRSSLEHGL